MDAAPFPVSAMLFALTLGVVSVAWHVAVIVFVYQTWRKVNQLVR